MRMRSTLEQSSIYWEVPSTRTSIRTPGGQMVARQWLGGALAIGAAMAYFAAYYEWVSIDEPLPGPPMYAGPAVWRQTEGFMNLSVELVYFGLVCLGVLTGCASAQSGWASQRIRAIASTLGAALAAFCGVGVLAALVGRLGGGPLALVLLLVTVTLGVGASLVNITLAWSTSQPKRGWLRVCSTILTLVISLGMLIALVSTTIFGVDLAIHGVPIITGASPGGVTLYGVAAVPSEGYGYNLQRGPTTGSWLGNLGVAAGLLLLATALSVTVLRTSPSRS
jgi:hypothetical protein